MELVRSVVLWLCSRPCELESVSYDDPRKFMYPLDFEVCFLKPKAHFKVFGHDLLTNAGVPPAFLGSVLPIPLDNRGSPVKSSPLE